MEKSHKPTPSEFLADRRKAIMEKAIERRKTAVRNRLEQSKIVGPLPPFHKPLSPTAPR
jgi:hypothetical protein